jgi:hypothetical protein
VLWMWLKASYREGPVYRDLGTSIQLMVSNRKMLDTRASIN